MFVHEEFEKIWIAAFNIKMIYFLKYRCLKKIKHSVMYVKMGFSLSLIWNDPTYVYHNLFQILDFILNFYYVIGYTL